MKSVKTLIDSLATGIKGTVIKVKLADLGEDLYGREITIRSWLGFVIGRRVELNTHSGPYDFFTNPSESILTLFHEITHQFGAVDGGEAYNDAHQLEELVDHPRAFALKIRNELINRLGKKNCPYSVGENAPIRNQWPDNE